MSRLFDDAAGDFLTNANAPASVPLAILCQFNSDDGALDNQAVVSLVNDGSGNDNRFLLGWNTTAGSPDGVRAISDGGTIRYAQTIVDWTADTWHHGCAIFVSSTDRRIFLDGTNKVTNTSDDGTPVSINKTIIGAEERQTGEQGFVSGKIAEVAIYDLSAWPGATDSDKADNFEKIIPSLGAGYSPLFFPLGLVSYWKLIRGLNDRVGGYNMTATGTAVDDHPRVIYPSKISTPLGVVEVGGVDYTRTIDDSVGLIDAESLVKEMYRTFDESMGVIDIKGKVSDSIRIVAESLGITDTFSKEEAKVISESLGITDAVSRTSVILRTLAESLGITDSVSEVWVAIRTLSESLDITDEVSKDEAKIILESINITDADSKVLDLIRVFVESLDIGDDITKVEMKVLSESLGMTDAITRISVILRTLTESLGITDELSELFGNLQTISDEIGIVDTTSKVHIALRTLSENLGLTDDIVSVFAISRIISDTEGITDGLALQRVMTVADTLGITDDITRLIDYLRLEDDDIGLLDSMVRVSLTLRTIDDDMDITDEVSAQLGALLKAVWAFVVMRQTGG